MLRREALRAAVVAALSLLAPRDVFAQAPVGVDIGPGLDRWDDGSYHPDSRLQALLAKLGQDGVESVRLDVQVRPGETAKLEAYKELVRSINEWSGGKVKVYALLDRVIVADPDPMKEPLLAGDEPTAQSTAWIAAYTEQAASLARELGAAGVRDFELVNEPNNWSLPSPNNERPWMSGANFGRLLAQAGPAIEKARREAGEPRALLVSGPLVVDDTWDRPEPQVERLVKYMAAARAAGWPDGPPPFDFVGVHPYLAQQKNQRTPDEGDQTLADYTNGVLGSLLPGLAAAAGDPNLRFVASEVGVPIEGGDKDRQAWVMAHLLDALDRRSDVAGIEAFHDFAFGSRDYGLLESDGSERPSYGAVKNAAARSVNAGGLPLPATPAPASSTSPAPAPAPSAPVVAQTAAPQPSRSTGITGALGR